MIKFNKPTNLNGSELLDELATVGIILDKFNEPPMLDGDNNLWLRIDPADEAKAKPIVDAHNGTIIPPEPTIEDKLASVGLSLDELKAALGGN